MRVIVDVMGGDHAPEETVKGVIQATQELNASFIMVGNRKEIERIGRENGYDVRRFDIVDTETYITMEDDPLCVVRGKQDSSMSIGLRMLAEGEGDAFVSTGNTGALFTGATLIVRKVKGIQRAGIGTILPFQTPVLLLDSGANVTVTEENLEQFGVIGAAYMSKMFDLARPRVGLFNNGVEEHKGTPLQQAAYQLLSKNPHVRFVGNIEGSVLPFNTCDVIVTDGFTGNLLLKSVEGLGKFLFSALKDVFYSNTATKMAALTLKKPLMGLKKEFDPSERGGSPILGISKPIVKAHGSSDAKAFKNAIKQVIAYAESGAIYAIAEAADAYGEYRKSLKAAETSDAAQGK